MPNQNTAETQFTDQVVLVTGSSRGLGAAFAHYLAAAGAHVIINSTGTSPAGDEVTSNIISQGGRAHHIPMRAEHAEDLVNATVAHAGRIDAIVHNAGFVQDKTVKKMTEAQWDAVLNLHLKASFQYAQAAWPHFEALGHGRLVFISSSAGLYGNFGQANYAAAKMGMYGLAQSIALEGAATNITCNCVAPFGATELNSGNMDESFKEVIKPEYVAPLVGYLAHPSCTESGSMFEASAGVFKKLRWQRSNGIQLNTGNPMPLQSIADHWSDMQDYSHADHPTDMREALRGMYER